MELPSLEEILSQIPKHSSVEVEIGCGNGHFLTEYCTRNQDCYLIGVEKKTKRCIKALAKINKRGLSNAAVIRLRAEAFLKTVPESSINKYHIYFPDPWPKTKHRKRRFLKMVNLEMIHRSLKKEGRIAFATDFFDYYLQAKILFLLHPGLELADSGPPKEIFTSIYGNKFKRLGKDIHSTAARKI